MYSTVHWCNSYNEEKMSFSILHVELTKKYFGWFLIPWRLSGSHEASDKTVQNPWTPYNKKIRWQKNNYRYVQAGFDVTSFCLGSNKVWTSKTENSEINDVCMIEAEITVLRSSDSRKNTEVQNPAFKIFLTLNFFELEASDQKRWLRQNRSAKKSISIYLRGMI